MKFIFSLLMGFASHLQADWKADAWENTISRGVYIRADSNQRKNLITAGGKTIPIHKYLFYRQFIYYSSEKSIGKYNLKNDQITNPAQLPDLYWKRWYSNNWENLNLLGLLMIPFTFLFVLVPLLFFLLNSMFRKSLGYNYFGISLQWKWISLCMLGWLIQFLMIQYPQSFI